MSSFHKIGLIKTRGFLAKSRSYEEGLVMKKPTLLSRYERYFKAEGGMIYKAGIMKVCKQWHPRYWTVIATTRLRVSCVAPMR